jgi:hypothetical protein
LTNVVNALNEASQRANHNAMEQENASNAS